MSKKRDRESSDRGVGDGNGVKRKKDSNVAVPVPGTDNEQVSVERGAEDTLSESGHSAHSLAQKDNIPTSGTDDAHAATKIDNESTQKEDHINVSDYGYTKQVNKRIDVIRRYDNAEGHTCYINKLVTKPYWSSCTRPNERRFYALSRTPGGYAQKLFVVGTIVSTFFALPGGAPPDQANVHIRPLDDRDRVVANNILGQNSEPNASSTTSKYEDIRMSKWMTYGQGGSSGAAQFSSVYDARDGLHLPVINMSVFQTQLKEGDLVIAECVVTRYHESATAFATVSRPKKERFSKWNATYTLNWIAVLDDVTPPPHLAGVVVEPETEVSLSV